MQTDPPSQTAADISSEDKDKPTTTGEGKKSVGHQAVYDSIMFLFLSDGGLISTRSCIHQKNDSIYILFFPNLLD